MVKPLKHFAPGAITAVYSRALLICWGGGRAGGHAELGHEAGIHPRAQEPLHPIMSHMRTQTGCWKEAEGRGTSVGASSVREIPGAGARALSEPMTLCKEQKKILL